MPSFSRHGNPYDNAQAEAGWSTLKTELLPGNAPYASLEEARLEIAWKSPGTSTSTLTLTAAIPLWATARPINLTTT